MIGGDSWEYWVVRSVHEIKCSDDTWCFVKQWDRRQGLILLMT